MSGQNNAETILKIRERIRLCDYLVVAQLFLQDNFLLKRPLTFDDIKPRLLGHWGTCHGINVAYANLKSFFCDDPNFAFVLGPGHGFPALQANLFIDGELSKFNYKASFDEDGIAYICKNFSWPDGFPSHSSPMTPGVISEGGELGYSLATAYGAALGHPEKTIGVLIGDGELETATAFASLNLPKIVDTKNHGKVIPILHLNGYKISAPTVSARRSERELNQILRGCGYTPIATTAVTTEFQMALTRAKATQHPFIIFKNDKGATGPTELNGQKIAGNYLSHQIPLPAARTDASELAALEKWLKSYKFTQLFSPREGFLL